MFIETRLDAPGKMISQPVGPTAMRCSGLQLVYVFPSCDSKTSERLRKIERTLADGFTSACRQSTEPSAAKSERRRFIMYRARSARQEKDVCCTHSVYATFTF